MQYLGKDIRIVCDAVEEGSEKKRRGVKRRGGVFERVTMLEVGGGGVGKCQESWV